MNPKKIYKKLVKLYPNGQMEFKEITKGMVRISALDDSYQYFDDDVILFIDMFNPENAIIVSFIFDKINPTFEALQLINNYNVNQTLSKAYIFEDNSEINYLKIEFLFDTIKNDKLALDKIVGVIENFTSDENLKDLQPLTNLTYK